MLKRDLAAAELERLQEIFPGNGTISLRQAAKYLGRDVRTLQANRSFPLKKVGRRYWVSLVGLAQWIHS